MRNLFDEDKTWFFTRLYFYEAIAKMIFPFLDKPFRTFSKKYFKILHIGNLRAPWKREKYDVEISKKVTSF